MQKINWQNDGDQIRLGMPITKIDVEKRRVSGFASVDNIDQHRDLVDALASKLAFAEFRGNIREQHDEKKAAGRLVDFKEDVVYDPKTDKFYQGVYVTAYVSKGAQDTWEKVLDGTLSGFSIGGNVLEAENEIDPTGQPYRRVTKYMLTELSLVDNPANHLANVNSFAKVIGVAADEQHTLTGDLAHIKTENIFVCNKCLDAGHGVHKSSEESLSCPACDDKMVKIGFVESADQDQKLTIKKMVQNHLQDREGGVTETMPETKVEVAEEEKVVEVEETPVLDAEEVKEEETTEVTEEETEEAPAEEEADKADSEEKEEESDDLSLAVGALRELTDRIEQSSKAQKEEGEALRKSLDDLDKRFEDKLNTIAADVQSLQERHEEFTKKFEGIDGSLGEMQKSIDGVESATAFKKSADFDQSADESKPKGQESLWGGSFLTIESL